MKHNNNYYEERNRFEQRQAGTHGERRLKHSGMAQDPTFQEYAAVLPKPSSGSDPL